VNVDDSNTPQPDVLALAAASAGNDAARQLETKRAACHATTPGDEAVRDG
jgi:hypothetical protein